MAKNSKFMKWLPYVLVGFLIIGGLSYFFYAQSLVPPATTPAANTSSVSITDWTSKQDLGELCPFTLYGDKGKITETEHIYDITYYETVSTEVMPDDFSKDLSEYEYIAIRPNPDEATDGWWTVYDYLFKNDFKNYDYSLYAYHEATDLYGNVLNIVGGGAWDRAADGNYTIPIWYPTVTKTEVYRGPHFEITDDLADLSQTTLDKLWNEKYYRDMPTLFSLADDVADHTKIGDYAMITETFAIEFDFNATISSVDENVCQVNFTADCDFDFLIEIDDDALYFITTESWNVINSNFEMNFEITTNANITCETVKLGRIVLPNRFFNDPGTVFTSLETIASA
jgi:hypothetical protein